MKVDFQKPFLYLLVPFIGFGTNAWSCTDEFKPVCGYWMHSPKTQTFMNECKMREAGAKKRHAGGCADQKPNASVAKPGDK